MADRPDEKLCEDEGELLASECKRYGLPVGLAGLLRHIYGNRDTTLAALTMAVDKWQARTVEAEARLSEYEQALRAVDTAFTAWSEDHNDGTYAYYKSEDLMVACIAARAALSGSAGSGP